jgi:phosphatidylglycerol:prolipoprotein diacylglycerol transferase
MSDTYPWFFSLGALIGLIWLGWVDPVSRRQLTSLPAIVRVDAGLCAFIFGLLGARLGYVLMHIHFYTNNPAEILKIWSGGLTWIGGAIGAIAGLSLYTTISRRPFWRLTDTLAMPALLFAFALWFGCMLDGCAYGKSANYGFLTPTLQDIFGTRAHRWPIQSAGAIFSLGTLAILERVRLQKPAEGVIASLGLSLISAGNLLLTFLRGDPVPILYGVRSDALGSVALFILGVVSLVYTYRRGIKLKHHTNPIA